MNFKVKLYKDKRLKYKDIHLRQKKATADEEDKSIKIKVKRLKGEEERMECWKRTPSHWLRQRTPP